MADNKRDYYEVLGVEKGADDAALKKAYRSMAKKYHPDMNPGDKEAEQKFKEVNEAYSVLSDSEKRSRYDQFGHAGVDPSMGGGAGGYGGFGGFDFGGVDLGDIFGNIFGGGGGSSARRNAPMQGDDVRLQMTISFEEAVFGCKKNVSYNRVERCSTCSGMGAAKGTQAETCSACHGSGQIRVSQRTMLGMMSTTRTCDTCHGTGKIIKNPCTNCRGTGYVKVKKTLEVTIPAGIDEGQRIALRDQGDAGRNNGPAGDLVIFISVRPHTIFERRGSEIDCDVPITFTEAALGAEIIVPTLDGDTKYTIPEGTQTQSKFRLKGKGAPVTPNSKTRGDLVFTVSIEVPKNLDESQKGLLRQFADTCRDTNYAKKKSFFDKLFKK